MADANTSVPDAALLTALALPRSGTPMQWIIGGQEARLITGTSADDGLAGPDTSARLTLEGGAGDDSYQVGNHYDFVHELADEGVDTVISTADAFTLPEAVENLIVLADRGYGGGNELNNRIEGGDYAQILNGGGGTDLLTGGSGADVFQLLAGGGWDVITDFETGTDRLHLAAFDGFATAAAVLAALRQNGDNVELDLGGGQGITFLNRSVADFSTSDILLPADPAAMTLTFAEEFDGFRWSVDGSEGWRTTYTGGDRAYPGNGDQQYFTDATLGQSPFRLEDGALVITASPGENALGLPYNSGLITSQGSFSQLYGFFEARIDIPDGTGWWPAFWMLPAAGGWPPELDILESFGTGDPTAQLTAHTSNGATRSSVSIPVAFPDIASGYHTYAVSWLPDEIRWYIDGVEAASTLTPADMQVPMYMLLNLAVSNATATAGASAEMSIDYVRAYAYSAETIAAHVDTKDTLVSAVSAVLPDGMHTLMLTGTGTLTGTGNALDNRLVAGAGHAALLGLAGDDYLLGGTGNDTLDGGLGKDRMLGGLGDDGYVVDNLGDRVIELAGQGTDTVSSSIGYTLGANLENLVLTGSAALGGAGNELANRLTANAAGSRLYGYGGEDTLIGGTGNDQLDGGSGVDLMIGGFGDDTYYVDDARDVVIELANQGGDLVRSAITYTLGANLEKLILTGTADIDGTGNELANRIFGNAGANRLNGGAGDDYLDGDAGNDTMAGGTGNDTYIVNALGDQVIELAGQGTDTVSSSIGYTLGANLENLVLTGTAVIGGGGNELANRLTANAVGSRLYGYGGNDTLVGGAGGDQLDGGSGADTMSGGAGDDSYIVDDARDVVVELAGQGLDVVRSSISYTLGANLEKLVLTGTANLDGTGNALDNRLFGNAGANRLDGGAGDDWIEGGAGSDTLTGGAGADLFVLAPGCGNVVVTDFGAGADRLVLSAFHAELPGMSVTQAGANTVLHFAAGESITLLGVASVTLWGDYILA
jgi:serralysin